MNEQILVMHNDCPHCANAAVYNADMGNPFFSIYISSEEKTPDKIVKALKTLGKGMNMPIIINSIGNKLFVNEPPTHDDTETLKAFMQEFIRADSAVYEDMSKEVKTI